MLAGVTGQDSGSWAACVWLSYLVTPPGFPSLCLAVPRGRYTAPIAARARRMAMEEQWYADRCLLRELLGAHPDWSTRQFAELSWPISPSVSLYAAGSYA